MLFAEPDQASIQGALELMERDVLLANRAVMEHRRLGFVEGRQWEQLCDDADLAAHRRRLGLSRHLLTDPMLQRVPKAFSSHHAA